MGMTKTEVAANAIRGIESDTAYHISVMETLRTLKLTTEEASELRKMMRGMADALGYDRWMIAKTTVNTYARDVSYR